MLKIGDFSRIANVSVRLLHHYENLGLFLPSHIDPATGYRYYQSTQMIELNKILALKDLGLSLQEIKLYIDQKISRDELSGMLKLKKSQVYQSIQDEMLRLQRIESRLQQLDAEDMPATDNVVIKTIPAKYYLSVRNRQLAMNDFGYFLNRLLTGASEYSTDQLGTLTIMEHSDTFPEKELDLEIGFARTLPKQLSTTALTLNNNLALSPRELPEVTQMATLLHVGAWGTGKRPYLALGHWIETHGYEIIGAIREVYIKIARLPEQENIIEFQIPVQPTIRNII